MVLTLSTKQILEWHITLHSQDLRSYTKSHGAEFISYFVDKKNTRVESVYEVSHTQFTYINQESDSCNERDDDEFNKCMDGFIPSRMNCTLPWDVKKSSATLDSPICSSKAEYDIFRQGF